jgi:hypothetical protein
LSGAWRLVADPFRPLCDLGKIAGLDQLVGLERGEGALLTGRNSAFRAAPEKGNADLVGCTGESGRMCFKAAD